MRRLLRNESSARRRPAGAAAAEGSDAQLCDDRPEGRAGSDLGTRTLAPWRAPRLQNPSPRARRPSQVLHLALCGSLWIRDLTNCRVFALPINGTIFVTDCVGCTLYIGCSRELRIRSTTSTDIYVHTPSAPDMQQCDKVRFAPYPAASLPGPVAEDAFRSATLDPSAEPDPSAAAAPC